MSSHHMGVHEEISRHRKVNEQAKWQFLRILLFVVVIIALVIVVFFSGAWRDELNITSVELKGNTTLSKDEIFSFARISDSLIMSGSLSLQIIEERIAKHPNINEVNVSNEEGNFVIEISEKNSFGMILSPDKAPLMVDDKLNLYYFRKELKNLDVPVITGLSFEIDVNNVTKDDYLKLKIAQYIISRASSLNKVLYKYISEISFKDTNNLILYCGDNGLPVYLMNYSVLKEPSNFINEPDYQKYLIFTRMKSEQLINIKNELFRKTLEEKLIMLNSFVKKIMPYKGYDSFSYVDLRYKGSIIVKDN